MSTKGTITIPGQNITLQKDQSVALARLRKTVAALPHTRDDKPITPKMVVYELKTGEIFYVCPFHKWVQPAPQIGKDSRGAPLAIHEDGLRRTLATHCFADPDAARAAKWSDK